MRQSRQLARKIGYYTAFTSGILLVVIGVMFSIHRQSSKLYDEQIRNTEEVNTSLNNLAENTTEVQIMVQRLLRLKDIDSLEILVASFDTICNESAGLISDVDADSTSVDSSFKLLETVNRDIITIFLQNDASQANLKYMSESNPAFETLRKDIRIFRTERIARLDASAEKLRKRTGSMFFFATLFSLICVVAGILWGIFFQRSIVKPLHRLISMLNGIVNGNGNLTERINLSSRDELGDVANLVNRFIEQQQSIISTITNNAATLSSSAGQLHSVADALARQSDIISGQSSTVNHSTGETAAGINAISSSTEAMSASLTTIATAAEEISASLNEVARNCQQESTIAADAANLAKNNRDLMTTLSTTAGQIDTILSTIDDIAEQTNMLALNATIEAASAGEAGRGFAVVASEVKSLAKLTARSTVEIGDQITAIQESIRQSTVASEKMLSVIGEVSSIATSIAGAVEEQSVTINEMVRSITQAGSESETIAHNVGDGARHLSGISTTIGAIDSALGENRQQMEKVQNSAGELSQLSAQLEAMVRKFKV
ncbi:MAG: methyl-accepting chemotaxis protein [Chitinispirillaceae bacterium]|nr:methyl-accepting chemotaxis protein [Chitinispirillaceae bacterium]